VNSSWYRVICPKWIFITPTHTTGWMVAGSGPGAKTKPFRRRSGHWSPVAASIRPIRWKCTACHRAYWSAGLRTLWLCSNTTSSQRRTDYITHHISLITVNYLKLLLTRSRNPIALHDIRHCNLSWSIARFFGLSMRSFLAIIFLAWNRIEYFDNRPITI